MLAVGLTGGIGAGKSKVADLLVEKGAVLVDADRIAREVVAPGGPAYQPMIDRFGPGIQGADGTIDRPAVAAIVFGDPEALAGLNAITHPAIGLAMIQRKDEFADTDHVVVLDIPLLKPIHRETLSLAAVVVVDTTVDIALDRLVNLRGMPRNDAEARVAAQIDRQTRLEGADLVIDNSGDEQQLADEVDRVWDELMTLRSRPGG
ncbi:MAG: dephospho-CoA kinase [Acidimicrobiales bacterium]